MEPPIVVNVQAVPRDAAAWTALAQRCERAGVGSLLVADHPGSGPAPFVALAAAAATTNDLTLGTYVANAGAWEPLALASEVATLDVVSGGRAVLGVGAGHTPAEWTMRDLAYPSPTQRVERMVELIEVTRRLLDGDTVTFRGSHLRTDHAHLEELRPVQEPIPLVVGGNGSRVLHYAAQHADVVALSGLGRTLPDGHRHEVDWATDRIDERVELVHLAAEAVGHRPELEALVQRLEITDDAFGAAAELAEQLHGVTTDDLLAAPYVLFGTVDELVAELRAHQRRWGISRFVVRAGVMGDAERLLDGLRAAAA